MHIVISEYTLTRTKGKLSSAGSTRLCTSHSVLRVRFYRLNGCFRKPFLLQDSTIEAACSTRLKVLESKIQPQLETQEPEVAKSLRRQSATPKTRVRSPARPSSVKIPEMPTYPVESHSNMISHVM